MSPCYSVGAIFIKAAKMLYALLWLIVCTAGVVVFAIIARPIIATQLDEWLVLPQPQRFSELYFADHAQLPTVQRIGKVTDVSFTIRNREYHTTSYRYQVTALSPENGASYVLADKHIAIGHNQAETITHATVTPNLGERIAIRVTVEYTTLTASKKEIAKKHSIQYWVKTIGAAS